jgi:5-methyltetrahydropteroyltriglutamate--homocysteine methyltransferase
VRISTDRIITTHVGSLPRPIDLARKLQDKDNGLPFDAAGIATEVRDSINAIVAKQAELGVDIVNDGEHSKSSFAAYTAKRLSGFEPYDKPFGYTGKSRDMIEFGPVYEEHKAIFSARPSRHQMTRRHQVYACTGPIRHIGLKEVETDIRNLKAAMSASGPTEGFITALSPIIMAWFYPNQFYKTEEEYLAALADAMREEYKMITDAGFILQIDDPRIASYYDRHPNKNLDDCRKVMQGQIEVINYALRGIPEDRIRFHTCYSTNVAPRAYDIELKDYVDLMLTIRAAGYSFEAANPRHDHEWKVWEDVKLPDGKVLIPGVVSHCVQMVEHPELVAQRIERYASVVGRERVIASNDCGFATAGAHDEVHPLVAWAKTKAMVDGAAIASRRLWG